MRNLWLGGLALVMGCGSGNADGLGQVSASGPTSTGGAGGASSAAQGGVGGAAVSSQGGGATAASGSASSQGGGATAAGGSASAQGGGTGVAIGGGGALSAGGIGAGGSGANGGTTGGASGSSGASTSIGGGSGQGGSSTGGGGQLGCWLPPEQCNPATGDLAGVYAFAVGDVDGDGHLDAVVAKEQLQTLFGNGGGALKSGPTSDVVALVIALGDVDGDGALDAVVGNGSIGAGVMHGKGDGTFAAPLAIGSPDQSASGIAIADFDGDGALDLAIAAGSLAVHFQKGGVLGAALLVPSCAQPRDVAAADVNGDGLADLLVLCEGTFVVGISLGSMGFSQLSPVMLPPAGFPGAHLALGDLDGNGTIDVVAGANVLLGASDGTFSLLATPSPVPTFPGLLPTPMPVGLADLDVDGILDLAFGGDDLGLRVARGSGDGTFASPSSFPSWGYCAGALAGDMNGDGHADFLSLGVTGVVGIVLAGTSPPSIVPADVIAIATGDIDADGHLDIVGVINQSGADIWVFRGHGDGTFDAAVGFSSGGMYAGFCTLADMDGDGALDAVVGIDPGQNGGEVRVLRGDGHGGFSAPAVVTGVSGAVRSIVVDDLNGDGVRDVVIAEYYASEARILLGTGGGAFAAAAGILMTGDSAVAAADFDGDGHDDIAAAGLDGGIHVASGDGKGGLSTPVIIGTMQMGQGAWLAAGDIDLDGFADLVVSGGGGLAVYRGGASGLSASASAVTFGGTSNVALVDFDGDGYRDIVALGQNPELTVMVILHGRGDGTFDPPILQSGGVSPRSLVVGDFDEDGREDVVTATPSGLLFVHNPW